MKLAAKPIGIATEATPVVLIARATAVLNDLHAGDRVIVTVNGKRTIATINISRDGFLLGNDQAGLFFETAKELGAKEGDIVDIMHEVRAESVKYIRKKMDGKTLSNAEILSVVTDVVKRNLTEVELTYFVAACSINILTFKEIVALTKAMADTGSRLHFGNLVIDKHCIGGVPGNRTTMITVPIMASLGLIIPKTSSRAITSPAGTADTMEVLAEVNLTPQQLRAVVEKVGACILWGGGVNLAPADDRIIKIERPLSIDVSGLMLASVMAKKYSVGSTHVLIDIPYGKGAKVETLERANALREQFLALGKELDMNLLVLITDGSQPIGYGVGPLLEAYDVLAVLKNNPTAPPDLREKALWIAGEMLEFVGRAEKGKGRALAEDALASCRALRKFEEIIDAQGRKELPPLAKYQQDVLAPRDGVVLSIDNFHIARVARLAGAPVSPNAGLLLYVKVGHKVSAGEKLFTVYADSDDKLANAIDHAKQHLPYLIH